MTLLRVRTQGQFTSCPLQRNTMNSAPLWKRKSRVVITCAKAVPPFLKEEVLSLGFPVLSEGVSYVETEGTMEDVMRLNLFIRTGHRILFLLTSFRARNPEELYREAS